MASTMSLRRSVLCSIPKSFTSNIPRSSLAALSSIRGSLHGKRSLVTVTSSPFVKPSPRIGYSLSIGQKTAFQARFKSDTSPEFRQWGFEDITSSLPTETASPSSQPQGNLILVDVREPAELVSTGIIPSAVSVPLGSQPDAYFLTPDEFETRFGYPKPGVSAEEEGKDIVFYCKAGVRAKTAAQLAVQAGYDPSRVGVYYGSWLDWSGKGGKVEKWENGE